MAQYLSLTQIASLYLKVLKRRKTIGRGTMRVFWRILLEWGRRLPPSLHLRRLLQRRPEIFDQLKGSDARRVGSLGNDFDLLLQEVQGIVCYVGAGQIHLPLIPSAPNPICPKPHLLLTPFAHNPT